MKYKKIIILVVFVILIIILIPIIRERIFFYQVRDKFLSTIYNMKRVGNFQVVYHTVYFDKASGESFGQTNTIFAKDGKAVVMYQADGSDVKSIGLLDGNEAFRILETDESLSGLVQTKTMYDIDKFISATSVMEEVLNGEFKKVETEEYNGKECYAAEVDFENEMVDIIYIDPETYYPLCIKSYENNRLVNEYEWQTIEIGNVTELPKYDLERIRENMVPLDEN